MPYGGVKTMDYAEAILERPNRAILRTQHPTVAQNMGERKKYAAFLSN